MLDERKFVVTEQNMNKFATLKEAFAGFRRNAVSDLTPPKISRALEGSFHAGAQAAMVLMCEALDIEDPRLCPQGVIQLFAEVQSYFEIAKLEANARLEEKENGKNRRT